MKTKIWLTSPHMGGGELKYINDAFETNWVAPLGPNVSGFERDLQTYLKINHVAVLSSGTAAIHLALILLGIEQNDEVLVSTFTFSATINPIVYQKAIPVFIDSEKDTWNMDPDILEEAIKDRIRIGKKPKAIIIVHLYGMPAKIKELLAIAHKYEIPVIEDAAESLGSKYRGQNLGTFAQFGILSFNGNKIITTSGGGALISNDSEAIEEAKFLATQAKDAAPHYQHSQIGYNYRMSNIIAGIGRGQMEVLESRVERRRSINRTYKVNFLANDGISFLCEPSSDFYSNYWLTTILVDPDKSDGITREDIRIALENDNIDTRPLWKPMHQQPVFMNFPKYVNGVSEALFIKGLCLPSGSNMSENDIERVITMINKVFSR